MVREGVVWNKSFEGEDRIWTDADDAGIRWYFESAYGIVGVNKIYDGITLIAEEKQRK